MSNMETYPFVWEMVYYPLVVVMLFINCFADKEPVYMEGEGKSDVIFLPNFCFTLNF